MPHRVTVSPRGRRARRRTFTGRVLGLSPDSSIAALKRYLNAAKLTPTPDEKLDLVILEDLDHYAELLARDGIPLIRDDWRDSYPTARRVTIKVHPTWLVMLSSVLTVSILDDVLAALCHIDIIPWM